MSKALHPDRCRVFSFVTQNTARGGGRKSTRSLHNISFLPLPFMTATNKLNRLPDKENYLSQAAAM